MTGSDTRMEMLAREHSLDRGAVEQIRLLLDALAAEPDPHTTVSAFDAALDVHVADSLSGLAIADLVSARRIADLGAGAGFPGLVLAVALPRAQVDLVEATGRKAAVIERLARAARVDNARAVVARAEEWAAPGLDGRESYDAVTARAVGSLAVLAEYAAPLLRAEGVLVAWKGARDPEEEHAGALAADMLGLRAEDVRRVVPFPGAEHRHLHVLRKIAPTPERFPRRAGMARKRPLA